MMWSVLLYLKLKSRRQEGGKDTLHGEHGTLGNKSGNLLLPPFLSYGTVPGPSHLSRKKPVPYPTVTAVTQCQHPAPPRLCFSVSTRRGQQHTHSHF